MAVRFDCDRYQSAIGGIIPRDTPRWIWHKRGDREIFTEVVIAARCTLRTHAIFLPPRKTCAC